MIILAGAQTPLGSMLLPFFRDRDQVASFDLFDADASDHGFIERLLDDVRPDVFINCHELADADECEFKREFAYVHNAFVPGYIASSCAKRGIRLVHFSTAAVYRLDESRFYRESDPVDPLNAYGDAKLLGERRIAESGCEHIIFRVPVVLGRGSPLLTRLAGMIHADEEIVLLAGQILSVLNARDAAAATAAALDLRLKGIYNIANEGPVSASAFVQSMASLLSRHSGRTQVPRVREVSYDDFLTAAEPWRYLQLDCRRFHEHFRTVLGHWQGALESCIAETWRDF